VDQIRQPWIDPISHGRARGQIVHFRCTRISLLFSAFCSCSLSHHPAAPLSLCCLFPALRPQLHKQLGSIWSERKWKIIFNKKNFLRKINFCIIFFIVWYKKNIFYRKEKIWIELFRRRKISTKWSYQRQILIK